MGGVVWECGRGGVSVGGVVSGGVSVGGVVLV